MSAVSAMLMLMLGALGSSLRSLPILSLAGVFSSLSVFVDTAIGGGCTAGGGGDGGCTAGGGTAIGRGCGLLDETGPGCGDGAGLPAVDGRGGPPAGGATCTCGADFGAAACPGADSGFFSDPTDGAIPRIVSLTSFAIDGGARLRGAGHGRHRLRRCRHPAPRLARPGRRRNVLRRRVLQHDTGACGAGADGIVDLGGGLVVLERRDRRRTRRVARRRDGGVPWAAVSSELDLERHLHARARRRGGQRRLVHQGRFVVVVAMWRRLRRRLARLAPRIALGMGAGMSCRAVGVTVTVSLLTGKGCGRACGCTTGISRLVNVKRACTTSLRMIAEIVMIPSPSMRVVHWVGLALSDST